MDITTTSTASIVLNNEVENNTTSVERIILFSILGVGFTVVTVLFSRFICKTQEKQMRVVPQEVLDHIDLNNGQGPDNDNDKRWLSNVKIESPA